MISKSNERGGPVRVEITSMIQIKITPLSSTLLPPYYICFHFNEIVKQSFGNKICKIRHTMGFFAFNFPAISFVTLAKAWNLTVAGFFVLLLLSHWLGKRGDLEQKIARYGNKS